ncbi:MAG TPA: peptidase M16, partial [Paenibacillus sp.]|nr:peptidase M16 [Paenibacillus sp.]
GRVRDEVEAWKSSGVPEELFERTRRKKIGGFYRMLNSPEAIAGEFTKHRFRGTNVFDVLELYEQITLDEVAARLQEHFDWEQLSVCIVKSE